MTVLHQILRNETLHTLHTSLKQNIHQIYMYIINKNFVVPRLIGIYDDGSESLDSIRDFSSFHNSIRFVVNPSVLEKHPVVDGQSTFAIITKENVDKWGDCKGKFNMTVCENGVEQIPRSLSKNIMTENILQKSCENMKDESIVVMMSYLLSITHVVFPDKCDAITKNTSKWVNVSDKSIIQKTVWVTNMFKTKNYEDRKVYLKNLRKLSETKIFDEVVIYGDEEYITKIKGDNIIYKNVTKNNGVSDIGTMLRWIYEKYSKGTSVFLMRQESTQMEFSTIQSANRFDIRSCVMLNAFILPDIPDPRPELYQRGDPRTTCGYMFVVDDDTTFEEGGDLDKCSLYSSHAFAVVMREMMSRRYKIGNASRQIGIAFPNIRSFVLDKMKFEVSMGIVCPEGKCITYYPSVKRKEYLSVRGEDVTVAPITEGVLEVKTIHNMTNKMMKRGGYPDNLMYPDSEITLKADTLKVFDGEDIRFYKKIWNHNKQMMGQTYWGEGVPMKETSFTHNSFILNDCVFLSSPNNTPENAINIICSLLLIENDKMFIVNSNSDYKPMIESIKKNVLCKDFSNTNIYGGKGTKFTTNPSIGSFMGFVPSLIGPANKAYRKTQHIDVKMMKMLGETNGIIVGTRWRNKLTEFMNEKYPEVKWISVPEAKDVKPDVFATASYVIGTRDSGAWIGTFFVSPEDCKVIEIANEFDNTPHWFFMSRAMGVSFKTLPLKQEMKKRCFERVKQNIHHYM